MAQTNRTARVEARITPDALAIIKHAAELQGRSVSDFMVSAAEETARRAINDSHIIHLSVADQRRFAELLLEPPPLSSAMQRAKKAHANLIGDSTNAQVSD